MATKARSFMEAHGEDWYSSPATKLEGVLIRGLGNSTKKVNKNGNIYFVYEYPRGTAVTLDKDVNGTYLVRVGDRTIATFGKPDANIVWKYVKIPKRTSDGK